MELSFVGGLIFFFFKISYKAQEVLATIYAFILIRPAICLAKFWDEDKKLPAESRRQNSTEHFAVLDTLIWHQKCLWKYLILHWRIQSYISGTKGRFNIYEHLINWNPIIPVIGFEEEKTSFMLELLFKRHENGSRGCDLIFLTRHRVCGTFKLISKDISASSEVEIKAVWLTGDDRGKVFTINRASISSKSKPSIIYYPPKWLIWMVELVLSGSIILAFFEFTKNGWGLLKEGIEELISFSTSTITPWCEDIFYRLLN